MVSIWLLPLAGLAGAGVGALLTWAWSGRRRSALSRGRPPGPVARPEAAASPSPLGIDVGGAVQALEERYRGRRAAGDDDREDKPDRPTRRPT
jgi:hypothetical protein